MKQVDVRELKQNYPSEYDREFSDWIATGGDTFSFCMEAHIESLSELLELFGFDNVDARDCSWSIGGQGEFLIAATTCVKEFERDVSHWSHWGQDVQDLVDRWTKWLVDTEYALPCYAALASGNLEVSVRRGRSTLIEDTSLYFDINETLPPESGVFSGVQEDELIALIDPHVENFACDLKDMVESICDLVLSWASSDFEYLCSEECFLESSEANDVQFFVED